MRPEIKPKYLIILSTALFCVRAAAEQAQIEASGIGEVVVRGQRNTPKESGDNYTVKGSTSATKLDLKLKETPQSISTFTRQQMQDQNLQDLDSVLQEAPGITVLQDSITGMGEAQFYSRGFAPIRCSTSVLCSCGRRAGCLPLRAMRRCVRGGI